MTEEYLLMKTTLHSDPLWQRLKSLDMDKCDVALPFSQRLARENGWSLDYAKRVIGEYKRFLYLTVSQELPVTPSDDVDQAWHLHMLYSRHYWGDLCDRTLGAVLHHGPTEGGPAEGEKYRQWYERTLGFYAQAFGEAPPTDIWPDSERRFANVEHFRRVDTSTSIVVKRSTVAALLLGFLSLQIAGCNSLFDENPLLAIGLLIIVVIFAVKLMIWGIKNSSGGSGGGGGFGGCGGCGGCS